MRVFGTKRVEPTDEDRVAIARLSAVAARFKGEPTSEFTDVEPDPFEAPEPSSELEASEDLDASDEQEELDEDE